MSTWPATLELQFRPEADATVLSRRHSGPLQVQKALYPEGRGCCHAILIHPPGGIAGGDTLDIRIRVDAAAHALVTTPGATKWYKSAGRPARQSVRSDGAGAFEGRPQETIVVDAAEARSEISIDLRDGAATIGWDIVALGRRASGERFERGAFAQSIRLRHDGALLWHERTRLVGGDPLLDSAAGLNGGHVFGSIWAWGPDWSDEELEGLRADCAGAVAPTRLAPRLVVARAAGHATEQVRERLERFWIGARPRVFAGLAVQRPRIWAT